MKRDQVMGIHAVEALLKTSPERLTRVWMQPREGRLMQLHTQLRQAGIAVQNCDGRTLDRLSDNVRHQGVIAEFMPRESLDDQGLDQCLDQSGQPLLLVLDGVTDPHNLGACIRSAAAAGADAVVVPKDRSAGLTPVTRRSSAGATERIPLARVTNLARCLRRLAERGLWRVGLDGAAQTSIQQTPLAGPLALVLGGEERGMRRLTREHCDQLLCIPMPGAMESLNVSVAAGIALFEAVRGRSAA